MTLKRLSLSVFGGVSILFLSLVLGLILTRTGHSDAAQSFIKYTLGWAFSLLGFIFDTCPGSEQRWTAIFLSWFVNIVSYSFVIYSIQLWWAKRTKPS
jgi:hypothetical protein